MSIFIPKGLDFFILCDIVMEDTPMEGENHGECKDNREIRLLGFGRVAKRHEQANGSYPLQAHPW